MCLEWECILHGSKSVVLHTEICLFCNTKDELFSWWWLNVFFSCNQPFNVQICRIFSVTINIDDIIVLWLFQGQRWDMSIWNLPLRIINALCCSAWINLYKETKWLCSAGVWLSAKTFPNNQTVVDGKWCNANICRCKFANK